MLLVNIATSEKIPAYAWTVFYKLKTIIKVNTNTLSAKVCFLKLKIGTPFASNLFKTATSFLYL